MCQKIGLLSKISKCFHSMKVRSHEDLIRGCLIIWTNSISIPNTIFYFSQPTTVKNSQDNQIVAEYNKGWNIVLILYSLSSFILSAIPRDDNQFKWALFSFSFRPLPNKTLWIFARAFQNLPTKKRWSQSESEKKKMNEAGKRKNKKIVEGYSTFFFSTHPSPFTSFYQSHSKKSANTYGVECHINK